MIEDYPYLTTVINVKGTDYGYFQDKSIGKIVFGATNYLENREYIGEEKPEAEETRKYNVYKTIETRRTLALPLELLSTIEALYTTAKKGDFDEENERDFYYFAKVRDIHRLWWNKLFETSPGLKPLINDKVFGLGKYVKDLGITLSKKDLYPVCLLKGAINNLYLISTTEFGDLQIVVIKFKGQIIVSLENYAYPIELIKAITEEK